MLIAAIFGVVKMNKLDIEKEFNDFMEFPSDNKDYVSSVSAKLFAQHCVDKSSSLNQMLQSVITTAFDNERDFIAQFLPGGIDDVNEIHVASSGVKVNMRKGGISFSTIIDFDDFMEWMESKTK